eukprot:11377750-Alexandrium_andersonii.AAC.1
MARLLCRGTKCPRSAEGRSRLFDESPGGSARGLVLVHSPVSPPLVVHHLEWQSGDGEQLPPP